MSDPAPAHTRRPPSTTRTSAVRAALSPLGSARAAAVLGELAARGAPVPAPVLDRGAALVGVLVALHDVGTGQAVAGGIYTVRDDATVEVLGPWSTDSAHPGLSRRVLWELEAEARRRGFSQAVASGDAADGERAGALVEGGYTAVLQGAGGGSTRGKRLTRS